MRAARSIGAAVGTVLIATTVAHSTRQAPAVRSVDEATLREYAGAYQWGPDAFVYLQLWNELAGTNQLFAVDDSGEVRTLYPTDRDRFFAGPGAAISTAAESRVEFHRDAGRIASLTWRREGAPARSARRADIERHEDVAFSSGDVRLSGTLIAPSAGGRHPATILVHGSGPASRDQIVPFARFLVRHGMAVLAYDKRGVNRSTGDWKTASFDDLAGDVVAAFEYLKTRRDIDGARIGLLGVSQAGWVMPLAAVRAKDLAFLISVSGPGVPAAETTIDHAHAEMTGRGMKPQMVDEIVRIMKLQYRFAQTGQGWDEYAAARRTLAARIGKPPETFPETPDDPQFQFMRRLYFYDPAPTLRRLQLPVLALFGELDNNVLPDKNKAAWQAALAEGGNRDYTLEILPRANHLLLEAKAGDNDEMKSLQRFAPSYFPAVREWLTKRVPGFGRS